MHDVDDTKSCESISPDNKKIFKIQQPLTPKVHNKQPLTPRIQNIENNIIVNKKNINILVTPQVKNKENTMNVSSKSKVNRLKQLESIILMEKRKIFKINRMKSKIGKGI
eukprot:UN24950